MATKYQQQATAQLNPAYAQAQTALQSQIPAIQQLYQTLTAGLQSTYDNNLTSGVQQINEDASARGVLRSTLPNDARTSLTGQLGAALQQSLGELGANQAKDIAGINTQLGQLGIDRAKSINDLAGVLQQQAFQKQQQAFEKQQAQIQLQIAKQNAANRGSSSSSSSYSDPVDPFLSKFTSWLKKNSKNGIPSRQAQDKYINSLFTNAGIKSIAARQVVWDAINAQYQRPDDPTKDWTWR